MVHDSSRHTAVVTLPCSPEQHDPICCIFDQPAPPQADPCSLLNILSILPTHSQLSSTTSQHSPPVSILRSFNTSHATITLNTHSSALEPYVPCNISPTAEHIYSSSSLPFPLPLPPSSRTSGNNHGHNLHIRFSTQAAQILEPPSHQSTANRQHGWRSNDASPKATSPPEASHSAPQHDHPLQHPPTTTSRHSYARRAALGIPAQTTPTHLGLDNHLSAIMASHVPVPKASPTGPASQEGSPSISPAQTPRVRQSFQALLSMVSAPLRISTRLRASNGGHDIMEAAKSSLSAASMLFVQARRPTAIRRRSTFSDLIARDALYAQRAAERVADITARTERIVILHDVTPVINGATGGVRRSRSFEGLLVNSVPGSNRSTTFPASVMNRAAVQASLMRTQDPAAGDRHDKDSSSKYTMNSTIRVRHTERGTQARTDSEAHSEVKTSGQDSSWAVARSQSIPKSVTSGSPTIERSTASSVSRFAHTRTPNADQLPSRSSLPVKLHAVSPWQQQQRLPQPSDPLAKRHASGSLLPSPIDGDFDAGCDGGDYAEEGILDKPRVSSGIDGVWARRGGRVACDSGARTSDKMKVALSWSSAHQLHQLLGMGASSGGTLTGLAHSSHGGVGGGRGAAYERRTISGLHHEHGSSSPRGQMILDVSSVGF